jgi:hypothetical protein
LGCRLSITICEYEIKQTGFIYILFCIENGVFKVKTLLLHFKNNKHGKIHAQKIKHEKRITPKKLQNGSI